MGRENVQLVLYIYKKLSYNTNMFKILNQKYRFFKRKVEATQKAIWDLEFTIAKSRQVREGVRQDRDRTIEAISQIETTIKGTEKKEDKEKLEVELKTLQENATRYEAQMKMIDEQIEGGWVTDENPAGIGIKERMASLASLREMYKDYLSKI